MAASAKRTVSVVLFDGFELLDVFGPVELLGRLPEDFTIEMLGPAIGPIRSNQGTEVLATRSYAQAGPADIVMVPGGLGTRSLVADTGFTSWLAEWSQSAALVTSVCTGSALLAVAGLLDGYQATSNTRAFAWASTHGSEVDWVASARWVHDRNRWTSSGVAAGMDMTAALIAELFGPAAAASAAEDIEFEIHADPDWDPFAAINGLG